MNFDESCRKKLNYFVRQIRTSQNHEGKTMMGKTIVNRFTLQSFCFDFADSTTCVSHFFRHDIRLAVIAREHAVGFGIIHEFLFLAVKFQLASEAIRDIGEMRQRAG